LFGETILDVVYDIKAQDNNIEFIEIAEKAMHVGLEAAIPGQFLVDVFPICSPCPSPCTELGSSMDILSVKYVPSWFPGARFKHLASEWKPITRNVKDLPFAYAKKRMVRH
jgi:hypothetical protein